MSREPGRTILIEAGDVVADRQQRYGDPVQCFTAAAKMWSAILGADVTPAQVVMCMIGLKIAREAH